MCSIEGLTHCGVMRCNHAGMAQWWYDEMWDSGGGMRWHVVYDAVCGVATLM